MKRQLIIPIAIASAVTVAAMTDEDGSLSVTYRFDMNGTPSTHSYKLIWPNEDSNLQAIEVLNADTGTVVQTLPAPGGSDLVYRNVYSVKSKILEAVDYNFDNYADLRITKIYPYSVDTKSYVIYLYDPTVGEYVINDGLTALQRPLPNMSTGRIDHFQETGWGGTEYTRDSYTISSGGTLRLDKKVTQSVVNEEKWWIERSVRERVDGELQTVCRLVFRHDGLPAKRLWGTRTRCEPYMKRPRPKN